MKVKGVSCAVTLAILLIIPDIVFHFYESNFYSFSTRSIKEFFLLVVLGWLILNVKSYIARLVFWSFFTLLTFIATAHYAFFHGYLLYYEIGFFFSQFDEVISSLKGIVSYVLLPFVLWGVQWSIGVWMLRRCEKNVKPFGYAGIILVLLLAIIPLSAYKRHNISVMMPKRKNFSVVNTYNAIALFLGKELPKYLFSEKNRITFKRYEVDVNDTLQSPRNIIVVMGESLGYKYMHLFGYDKQNTPYLDRRKNRKNFLYKKGYASGVDTLTAVPTFFTLKREPENTAVLSGNITNLFSLAKKRGYRTYYFTTQKLNIMAPYLSGADTIKRFEGFDEKLIEALKAVDFSQRNFIVLHQRNSHSPYETSTPSKYYKFPFKNKPYAEYMRNSYANSVLYSDALYEKLFRRVDRLENSIVFIVPDHAEMMGFENEGGRFGHSFLDKEAAKVPFLIYWNGIDPNLEYRFFNERCFNHYTFGKLVAASLGFEVKNPNENGTYYIQGTSIDGSNGFIIYDTNECVRLNKGR
jgi:glucan phosphoethanolaminetransferase (alkaline phosphatase superfamily)